MCIPFDKLELPLITRVRFRTRPPYMHVETEYEWHEQNYCNVDRVYYDFLIRNPWANVRNHLIAVVTINFGIGV